MSQRRAQGDAHLKNIALLYYNNIVQKNLSNIRQTLKNIFPIKCPRAIIAIAASLVLFTSPLFSIDFSVTGLNNLAPVTISVDYSDDWFGDKDSSVYDHRIARFACLLSDVAYTDVAAHPKDNALLDAYHKIGVKDSDIEFNYDVDYSDSLYGNNQAAFSIAAKKLSTKTIIFLVIRGTPLGKEEWLSNLNIADSTKKKSPLHEGFAKARDLIHLSFVSYLLRHKIDVDNCYILITGHSRGAAISNLIGAQICDKDDFLETNKTYVYTFACPNNTTAQDSGASRYNIIHNIVNPEDAVPMVPPNVEGWDYSRYGLTYTFINYWNTSHDNYSAQWQKIVKYSNLLIGRDYAPFNSGSFYPVQVAGLVKLFNDTVDKYYAAGTGIHGLGATLMGKIFSSNQPTSNNNFVASISDEDSGKSPSKTFAPPKKAQVPSDIKNDSDLDNDFVAQEEKKKQQRKDAQSERGIMKLFADFVNKYHKNGFEYLKNALNDMHACETYLSFMLALNGGEIYSKLGYCQFVISGQAEGVVLDKKGNILARFSDGYVNYGSLQKTDISAFSFIATKVSIGIPSNMEVDILITNESLINTPMTIKMERYNEYGVMISKTEERDISPRVNWMYRIGAGEETYITRDFRIIRLKQSESFHLTNRYKMRPEQYFHVAATTEMDTELNINWGCEVGCQAIYGIAKIGFNMERPDSIFSMTYGMGSRQTLLGPILLDAEALGKFLWAFGDLDDNEYMFNFVPEIRVNFSLRPVRWFSFFLGCAFDFDIEYFNEGAFSKSARRASLPLAYIGNGNQLGTAITFGIRLF